MGSAQLLGAPPIVVATFLILSPFFLCIYGTLLSHTTTLAFASIMLWSYFNWQLQDKWWGWLIAGIAWIFFYLDRPFTALLFAIPFAIDSVYNLYLKREIKVFKATILFALTASIGLLLLLLHNKMITGDFLTTPYLYYAPSQSLGFNADNQHTPQKAFIYLKQNVLLLDQWLWGFGRMALPVIIIASIIIRPLRWVLFSWGGILSIILGYMLFYFHGHNVCGPLYYFETLPFFSIIIAMLFKRLTEKIPKKIFVSFFVIFISFSAYSTYNFITKNCRELSSFNALHKRMYDVIMSAPSNSIVLVEDVKQDFTDTLVFNSKGLQSDPLLFVSLGHLNSLITQTFPQKNFFVFNGKEMRLTEFTNMYSRVFYDVAWHTMRQMTGTRGTNNFEGCYATAGKDNAGFLGYGKYLIVIPSSYQAVFDVEYSAISSNEPSYLEIASDHGRIIVYRQAIEGSSSNCNIVFDFDVQKVCEIEPRVFYGGSGMLRLRRVKITQIK